MSDTAEIDHEKNGAAEGDAPGDSGLGQGKTGGSPRRRQEMEDCNELIGEVSKNSREVVKIHVSTFKGKLYVDARIFVQDEGRDPGTVISTKKGLCLKPELVRELLPLMARAQERANELSGGKG